MVYTLNLQEASSKSIGDVALCLMVLKTLFLAIFVVGFSSIFHYASSHANPSVDDAKPSASDPKKKSYFPYFE